MSQPYFRGAITALITPFRDGVVDEEAFASLVERQIAAGIHGLVPVGTTGEASTLSHEEHRRVIELCVQTAGGRVPVIAGAGANSTDEAIELTRHAKTVGADGALLVSPYYNRPSQEGIFQHYKEVRLERGVAGALHRRHHPVGADGDDAVHLVQLRDLTAQLAARVGGHRLHDVADEVAVDGAAPKERLPVALALALVRGAGGVAAWAHPPYDCDRDSLAELHTALFLDSSPTPTKFALAHLGLCAEDVRLPLVPCDEKVRPKVLAAMREAGVIN